MHNKTTLLITSCLVIMTLSVPGSASMDDAAKPQQMTLVDARTKEILNAPPTDDSDSLYQCGGQAPLDTYCETGVHPTVWIHGFASPFPQAGTLESRLIHDGGAQVFRCDYLQGETVSCFVFGQPAPPQGNIYHDCYSYFPLTSGLLSGSPGPGEPSGIPGGIGPWQCLLVE